MFEEKYIENKIAMSNKIKNKIFDIIAVGVLLAAIAINLGALEWKDVNKDNIVNLLAEFVPLLLTSMLLTSNYYQKGVFFGKNSSSFIAVSDAYSDLVTSLNGDEISNIADFCVEYNDNALQKIQEPILKRIGISFKLYNEGNEETKPLKVLSRRQLSKMYNKHIVDAIIKCNKIKIKGIKVNNLLGNEDIDDISDLGKTETQLRVKHNWVSALTYTVSTAFMTVVAVKDILAWGWASIALLIFKLLFIFFRSYMSYFEGFNNVTISLNNQLARKTDILKQFKYWYENNLKNLQNNIKMSNNIQFLE